jgi:hypothetical protein
MKRREGRREDVDRRSRSVRPAWQSRAMEVWLALVGTNGIEHASAVVVGTPEAAVQAAMARALQKYGPQDWGRWDFRAEIQSQPVGLHTIRFIWADGGLRRG